MKGKIHNSLQHISFTASANLVWFGTFNMYPVGWAMCPKTNSYLQALDITIPADNNNYYRIEEGKCLPGIVGYTDQPATCTNANWASILDG